jgi:hypothetical protein
MALADIILRVKNEVKPEIKTDAPVYEAWNLIGEIDCSIVNSKIIEPFAPDEILRVSSLGYMCHREEILRARHKVKKIQKIGAVQQRVFDVGTAFHSFMQNNYFAKFLYGNWKCTQCGLITENSMKTKCQCGSESLIYEELSLKSDLHKLTGHPDGILVKGDRRWLLELKTINDTGYKMVTDNESPKDDHIIQTNMYMAMLKIVQCIAIYFNKNSGVWTQYYMKYNPQIVKGVLDKIAYMRKAIGDSSLPLPVRTCCASITCTRAKNCPVSKVCFTL